MGSKPTALPFGYTIHEFINLSKMSGAGLEPTTSGHEPDMLPITLPL